MNLFAFRLGLLKLSRFKTSSEEVFEFRTVIWQGQVVESVRGEGRVRSCDDVRSEVEKLNGN